MSKLGRETNTFFANWIFADQKRFFLGDKIQKVPGWGWSGRVVRVYGVGIRAVIGEIRLGIGGCTGCWEKFGARVQVRVKKRLKSRTAAQNIAG